MVSSALIVVTGAGLVSGVALVDSSAAAAAVSCGPGQTLISGSCGPVPAGYASPDGVQVPCQPGFFQPDPGAVSCKQAAAGFYVPSSASAAELQCPPGQVSSSTGAESCVTAVPGQYAPASGSLSALDCPPGYYSPQAGATSCTPADPGYEVAYSGRSDETLCPIGTYAPLAGMADCLTSTSEPTVLINGSPSATSGAGESPVLSLSLPVTGSVTYTVNGQTLATVPAGAAGTAVAALTPAEAASLPVGSDLVAATLSDSSTVGAAPLTVYPRLTGTTTPSGIVLPAATVGVPYWQPIRPLGGSGQFAYTNPVPADGLAISGGAVQGTPQQTGTFTIPFVVTDVATGADIELTAAVTVSSPTPLDPAANPPNPTYGNTVTLSVPGLPAGATGQVTFVDPSTTLCSFTLGSASSCDATGLAAGDYPVTAEYSGDSTYPPASAPLSVSVGPLTPQATASPTDTAYGHTVTLSVTGLGSGTGTVAFEANGSMLCSVTLPQTQCSTGVLTGGGYVVTARYPGDSNNPPAVASTSFDIAQLPTPPLSVSAPADTSFGGTVTLSASGLATGGAGLAGATGTVRFSSNGTILCQAAVSSGSASCATDVLPAGDYQVTASYPGDSNYGPSAGATSFTVTSARLATSMSQGVSDAGTGGAWGTETPGTEAYDAAQLFTSGSAADPPPSGQVTYSLYSTVNCTGTPLWTQTVDLNADGSVPHSAASPPLARGQYSYQASYSGDSRYQPSTTPCDDAFAVFGFPTSLSAAAIPSRVPYGGTVELTETGLPADATGSVTFSSGSSTLCTVELPSSSGDCVTSVLPAGAYTVAVVYSGDARYAGTTAPTAFTIDPDATVTSVTSPGPVVYSSGAQTVTLSARVGSPGLTVDEGSVSFSLLDSHGVTVGATASAAVAAGQAGVQYTLPAATPAGVYTVHATYTDTSPGDFTPSTDSSQTLTVEQPAAVTSADTAYFAWLTEGSFTITTAGLPTASIKESGQLPPGLSFVDHGDGTATISGTPGLWAFGDFPVTVTASNGVGDPSTQTLHVVVGLAPVLFAPARATFVVGHHHSTEIAAFAYPAPQLSETGALPAGVRFVDLGDGAATLSGAPAPGTAGTYTVTISATNGVGSVSQRVTVRVVAHRGNNPDRGLTGPREQPVPRA